MLRVNNIRLPIDHTETELRDATANVVGVAPDRILELVIRKQSVDARKKAAILFIYTVDIEVKDESTVALNSKADLSVAPDMDYAVQHVSNPSASHPVVVGTGPCGLFAGLILAEMGLRPMLLERGKPALERAKDVVRFWNTGELDVESNAQFGEGGAGTFSDGKLTTQIKDKHNRFVKVLQEFVEAGAPPDIQYKNKPHLGTDQLLRIVIGLREKIVALGGDVRFGCKMSDVLVRDNAVTGVMLDGGETIEATQVVLAIGHSARDTVAMLHDRGVRLESKPFSLGVRIEHPQSLVDAAQYGGCAGHPRLGAADYKLVHHAVNGRSVYTFCMCPGGQVIACSSERGGLVTNGMSAFNRNLPNANSALLVGVTPEDFPNNEPLAGIAFQRQWERKAFELGGGNYHAPVQLLTDFMNGQPSTACGAVVPTYRPGVTWCDVADCLPGYIVAAIREAIPAFDRKLKGFALPDAVMTGVETRSSSPVRIVRDEGLESVTVRGLYPGGEGAGYAGGIMSSAVDGIRIAEVIGAQSHGTSVTTR